MDLASLIDCARTEGSVFDNFVLFYVLFLFTGNFAVSEILFSFFSTSNFTAACCYKQFCFKIAEYERQTNKPVPEHHKEKIFKHCPY